MAKISLKLASKGKTSFDLSSNHITTSDFGQIQVSNFLPVVPGDKINASVFSEARFAPMVVPTFMDCSLVTRSFYVPMSAIWKSFEYYYTDRQDSSVLKAIPTVQNSHLVHMYLTDSYHLLREVSNGVAYDVRTASGGSATANYVFTEKGRLLHKLLNSLGYSINWNDSDTTRMSLLPLMAYARVAYDYIYPSQYVDGLGLSAYFNCTTSSEMSSLFDNPSIFIMKVVDLLSLPFRQDYFTAAWTNLNNPGLPRPIEAYTTPDSESLHVTSGRTELSLDTENPTVTQTSLNLLRRMYDFCMRNNIAGVRYADQLFARFGIGSRKSDPDMSQFIGQHIQPINVVDVTAMSAAQGQELGDLAGKAYINGNGNLFTFDGIDEFGYIVSLSFVMPKVGYYQGRKRWTTCYDRFDFYTPEFDMQMRAIRNDEVFADYKDKTKYTSGQTYGGNPSNRFAFAPNYSEYKKGDDYVTGDFRCDSLNTNLKPYYLMRDFDAPGSGSPLALSSDFLFQKQHEFDKIFAQMYTLRAPFSTREIEENWRGEVVCYDEKPVVLRQTSASTSGWLLFVTKGGTRAGSSDGSLKLSPKYLSLEDMATLLSLDEVTASDCYICDLRPAQNKFVVADVWIILNNDTQNHYVTSSSTESTVDRYHVYTHEDGIQRHYYTYDEFLSLWQDYIDHIYIRHHFDIKANRNMVPVSEEFMIEDGGSHVSVDMNGNRIV